MDLIVVPGAKFVIRVGAGHSLFNAIFDAAEITRMMEFDIWGEVDTKFYVAFFCSYQLDGVVSLLLKQFIVFWSYRKNAEI